MSILQNELSYHILDKPYLAAYIEQFNKLKEPYRSKAINNLLNDNEYTHNPFKSYGETGPWAVSEALEQGFWWGDSPEGNDFWSHIWTEIPTRPKKYLK